MEKNFFKLLELLLNKPLHLCAIGLFCVFWGYVQASIYFLIGGLFVVIAVFTWIDRKIEKNKARQKQENFRQQIIRTYKNMPKYERLIIDTCLGNKYRVFKCFAPKYLLLSEKIREYEEQYRYAIIALRDQRWGNVGDNPDIFTMHQEIFDILTNYKKTKF